eukprot:c12855_g1_i2.p1 GENE.c12855_g1_i2~~c12855_g1_i2.p1  ORF type:complete len:1009 (+),score=184.10 c12855_g1_i2:63-3089(+)
MAVAQLSNLFRHVVIEVDSTLDKEVADKLVTLMTSHGGSHSHDFSIVTHFVTSSVCTPDSARPKMLHIHIVAPSWITTSLEKDARENEALHYPGQVFEGVVFVLSGMGSVQRDRVREFLLSGGAGEIQQVGLDCTHLITPTASGAKFQVASQMSSVKIVTPKWVLQSVQKGVPEHEEDYCPTSVLPHLPKSSLTPCNPLMGVVAVVPGPRDSREFNGIRRLLRENGARVVEQGIDSFQPDEVTHVIRVDKWDVYEYSKPTQFPCATFISHLWVRASVKAGYLVPHTKCGGIVGMEDAVLCTTGYFSEADQPNRERIRKMAQIAGAKFDDNLNRAITTHLIAKEPLAKTSKKLKRALEWGVKIVVEKWLHRCLKLWAHVPEVHHTFIPKHWPCVRPRQCNLPPPTPTTQGSSEPSKALEHAQVILPTQCNPSNTSHRTTSANTLTPDMNCSVETAVTMENLVVQARATPESSSLIAKGQTHSFQAPPSPRNSPISPQKKVNSYASDLPQGTNTNADNASNPEIAEGGHKGDASDEDEDLNFPMDDTVLLTQAEPGEASSAPIDPPSNCVLFGQSQDSNKSDFSNHNHTIATHFNTMYSDTTELDEIVAPQNTQVQTNSSTFSYVIWPVSMSPNSKTRYLESDVVEPHHPQHELHEAPLGNNPNHHPKRDDVHNDQRDSGAAPKSRLKLAGKGTQRQMGDERRKLTVTNASTSKKLADETKSTWKRTKHSQVWPQSTNANTTNRFQISLDEDDADTSGFSSECTPVKSSETKSKKAAAPTRSSTRKRSKPPASPPRTPNKRRKVLESPPLVMIGGACRDKVQLEKRLGQFGALVIPDSAHSYDPVASHFVLPKLTRTIKVLCACAAGKWILKTDWLTESAKAGCPLPEEDFEWHNPEETIQTTYGSLWGGAPRRNRLLPTRPLHEMKIFVASVPSGFQNRRADFEMFLEAGGATVISERSARACPGRITHIASEDGAGGLPAQIKNSGALLVRSSDLVDLVCCSDPPEIG